MRFHFHLLITVCADTHVYTCPLALLLHTDADHPAPINSDMTTPGLQAIFPATIDEVFDMSVDHIRAIRLFYNEHMGISDAEQNEGVWRTRFGKWLRRL